MPVRLGVLSGTTVFRPMIRVFTILGPRKSGLAEKGRTKHHAPKNVRRKRQLPGGQSEYNGSRLLGGRADVDQRSVRHSRGSVSTRFVNARRESRPATTSMSSLNRNRLTSR